MEQLPQVLQSLGDAISALPSAISATTSQLPRLLSQLSSDLQTPLVSSVAQAEQEALLSNSTWLAGHLGALESLMSRIPASDVAAASREDLIAIVQLGSTKYDLLTIWAPDVYALVLLYILAVLAKTCLLVMIDRRSVVRVRDRAQTEGKSVISSDIAALTLAKPARSAIGHTLNATTSTVALGLQLAAFRLFALPAMPLRFEDVQKMSSAMKIILVSYGADLLFGDLNPEIYLHHLFTAALLIAGQICAFRTSSPKFFRLAQWLLLQATTEQSTFLAMALYHGATYYKTQGHRPRLQHSLLKASHALLRFTTFITFPQKIIPAIGALYWLGRMWNDISGSADGQFWLAWATIFIVTLLILQVKFCDDVSPICNYVHYKLHPSLYTHPPARTGPVMRFLFSLIPGASRRGRAAIEKHRRESPADVREHPPRPPLPTQGTLPIAMLFSSEKGSSGASSFTKRSMKEEAEETTGEIMEMQEANPRLSSSAPSHTRSPTNTFYSGAPLLDIASRRMSDASTRASVYSDASSLVQVTTELEGAGADSPDQRSEDKAADSTVQEVPVESQGTSLRDDGSPVDDEVESTVEVASSPAPPNPSAEDKDEDQKGEEEVTAVAK